MKTIQRFTMKQGQGPTAWELADLLGDCSRQNVNQTLHRMADHGLVRAKQGRSAERSGRGTRLAARWVVTAKGERWL